jgi:hypothetical protein
MKAQTPGPRPRPARRHKPGSVFVELGDLYPTLRQVAATDAVAAHEQLNMSRTIRRLIRDEATRLGILPKTKP